jgi:hypothetical protein
MEDTNDQTRNILLATRVALPHVVCPTLRNNVGMHLQSAIDLTVLQSLADGLGRHARPLFQRYFLAPEFEAEHRTAELFAKLVEIDTKGIFVFLFLEELNLLGERVFRTADLSDKSAEVEKFLDFLLTVARRDLGEEIDLEFLSKEFKVGIVLVAKTAKAQAQGIVPYLKAVDYSIAHGTESIYLFGFLPSAKTFHRTLDALDSDNRVAIEKRQRVRITPDMKSNFREYIDLAFVRVIRYLGDSSFEDRIQAAGIKEGMKVSGILLDVSEDNCVVDVRGVRCILRQSESAWTRVVSCAGIFAMHDRTDVVVKRIDVERGEVEVSRRIPDEDPWLRIAPPESGQVIEVTFRQREGQHFCAIYKNVIEILVPLEELSWLGSEAIKDEEFVGATENVMVLKRDDNSHTITASVRLLEDNPWPLIHKRFPKNTEFHGVVCQVDAHNVVVKLKDGLVGHIPRESMLKAGFEFADYERNVVVGQGLDVVVTKVFLEKKRIRLDLKRNVEAAEKAKRK